MIPVMITRIVATKIPRVSQAVNSIESIVCQKTVVLYYKDLYHAGGIEQY